jgi:hypothetical protein
VGHRAGVPFAWFIADEVCWQSKYLGAGSRSLVIR